MMADPMAFSVFFSCFFSQACPLHPLDFLVEVGLCPLAFSFVDFGGIHQ